jgi:hypothetical protein
MIFDEIHYDSENDYGFFCVLDEYQDTYSISPLLIENTQDPLPTIKNREKSNTDLNSLSITFRIVLINSLFMVGSCVSSFIICYRYFNNNNNKK